MGRIKVAKHRFGLKLTDASTVLSAQYPTAFKQRDREHKEIEKMHEAGFATPAVADWVLPNVFVSKKDSSLQFCIDHQRLNAVIEQ